MFDQAARASAFHALHRRPGAPLVLFNVWDAGSAKAVGAAGAEALATGSWAVAAAHGFADGEALPLDLALANLRRIVAAAGLPVSVDLEGGYGAAPDDVADTVARALGTGAVGVNLEDSLPTAGGALRPVAQAAARVAAARAAADRSGVRAFVNARCDVFLQAPPGAHGEATVAAALECARAYADAGADGLFLPGVMREELIGALAASSPLPLNVMVGEETPPLARLAGLGVARVSHGPGPYIDAMRAVGDAAHAVLAGV